MMRLRAGRLGEQSKGEEAVGRIKVKKSNEYVQKKEKGWGRGEGMGGMGCDVNCMLFLLGKWYWRGKCV